MSAYRVRLATESDAGSVCRLHRAAWEEVFSASNLYPSQTEAESRWSDLIRNKMVIVVLCEFENKLVGFIASLVSNTSFQITDLYVYPEYRRHGIGRALMNEALKQAKHRPATLWVAETSGPAISLYQKTGFLSTGETKSEPRRIDGARLVKMYRDCSSTESTVSR